MFVPKLAFRQGGTGPLRSEGVENVHWTFSMNWPTSHRILTLGGRAADRTGAATRNWGIWDE